MKIEQYLFWTNVVLNDETLKEVTKFITLTRYLESWYPVEDNVHFTIIEAIMFNILIST